MNCYNWREEADRATLMSLNVLPCKINIPLAHII
uniref:Uncharacterized protein n=1 Tax=Anguilla anguilla TaxID=7936 RepID=A0A0E9PPZ7_ANGAN